MTKFFTYNFLIVLMAISSLSIIGQPIVKIGHYTGCSNTELLIPVEIENFEDVAALTLYIGVGLENINDIFSTGTFLGGINLTSQSISLNWLSFTPASIDTGIMCNIRILLKKDALNFNFDNNCEIVLSDLTIVENVEYIDGSLVALNSFIPNPLSQSVIDGGLATIELPNLPEDITCQWQWYDSDSWINIVEEIPYVGVITNTLTIQPVFSEMNGNLYRCYVSNDICSEGSEVSELLVTPNDIGESIEQNNNAVNVFPNPVNDYLNCSFNTNVQEAEVRLININGELLKYMQLGDVGAEKTLLFDMIDEKAGTYLFQLLSQKQVVSTLKILRK